MLLCDLESKPDLSVLPHVVTQSDFKTVIKRNPVEQ